MNKRIFYETESIQPHETLERGGIYTDITYERDHNGNLLIYSGNTLIAIFYIYELKEEDSNV